jgi:hypothetical protein
METLIFKHKGMTISRRLVGAFWILSGITALPLLWEEPLTVSAWVRSVLMILLGGMFFTPLVGNTETRFMAGISNLKIKWATRIREIIIQDNEIEKIILRNKKIEIRRKEKKAVVLLFESWKLEDKTKVYEFLIDYARMRNLALEK